MKLPLLPAAALLGLALSIPAHAAETACEVPEPRVPLLRWQGQAAFKAQAWAKGGRVQSLEIRLLRDVSDRQVRRALVYSIEAALRNARCAPGEHRIEQRFDFDLRQTPMPPLEDGCELQPPALPEAAANSSWRGQAAYRAQAEFQDGRMLGVTTQTIAAPPDKELDRALRLSVATAMQAAQCPPGPRLVERRFDFDIAGDATARD